MTAAEELRKLIRERDYPWVNVETAARYLGCNAQSLREKAKSGSLGDVKFYQASGQTRISLLSLYDYVTNKRNLKELRELFSEG